jgi:hypothetical protein
MKFVTIIAVLFSLFVVPVAAQEDAVHGHDFRIVFEDVQHGIETGNVGSFSPHLGAQVQVALRGGESGYYSANHAYYLIEDFFKSRRVVSFEFSQVGETEATPYGTGTAVFTTKGIREIAQVYVALMRMGERWVIAEINIY